MPKHKKKNTKLAEKYWKTVDYRTHTIHAHVIRAYVAGYEEGQKEIKKNE